MDDESNDFDDRAHELQKTQLSAEQKKYISIQIMQGSPKLIWEYDSESRNNGNFDQL